MAGHRRKRSMEPPDDGGGSARLTAPPLGASARALRTAARGLKGADNGRSSNQGTRSGRRRHVGFCIWSGSYWLPGSSWVKFSVTVCFYGLSTGGVAKAASLEKAVPYQVLTSCVGRGRPRNSP